MDFSSERSSNKEEASPVYLTKLQKNPKKRKRVSRRISPHRARRISEPILSMEDFERRFQFNNLVREYNHLIAKKKPTNVSVDEKDTASKLFLPIIKEIKIKKHGMNDSESEVGFNESEYETENKNEGIRALKNYNSSENNNIDSFNTKPELKDKSSKTKFDKTHTTLSQSFVFNKSNIKGKMSLDYDKEKKRLLLRNLSNDSIFAQYKVRYMLALKDYKDKTKLAQMNYQNELEKIRNEKLPKSKNEELFKVYELDFNSNKMKIKLKNEFNFFQCKMPKKISNETDLRLIQLFKTLKRNKDRKNIWGGEIELKSNCIKPSQRSIKNMLRKEKGIEFYDEIKFDSPEQN